MKLTVECFDCHNDLGIAIFYQDKKTGVITIMTSPCKGCIGEAEDSEYRRGYVKGQKDKEKGENEFDDKT